MNSYTQDMKRFEREFKRKIKEERKQSQIEREKADKLKHELYFAEVREQKAQAEKSEKERIERIEHNTNFLQSIANKIQYKIWLLYRDILYSGFYQIESDLHRGKITSKDIMEAIQFLLSEKAITEDHARILNEIVLQ